MSPIITMEEVDGRTIRVARWISGKNDHLPILFFNGIGANLELIAPLAEQMAERDFITFDMPGIGGSPDPAMPYRPWMMARIADMLLDQFGYDKVDVIGISWGGGLAQQFALQNGARVGKLILVATTAGMLMVPGKISALTKMADPRRYLDPDFMLKNFKKLYGGKDEGSDAHVERIKPPTRMGYLYQLVAMVGWTSAPWLPLIRAETLIMMGDEDNIVPLANGKFLKALIANSRLEVIKGGGHLFLMAEADLCVRLIRGFLDDAVIVPIRKAA
ncbi:MAG: alpha/beta fold hydrolase [Pseudomonadota bacterium]